MTVFVLPNGDHANPPRGANSSNFGLFTPGVPTPGLPSGTMPFSGSPEPGTMVHCRMVACWPVYFTLGLAGSITAEGLVGSYVYSRGALAGSHRLGRNTASSVWS